MPSPAEIMEKIVPARNSKMVGGKILHGSLLSTSAGGATLLIFLQVGSRLMTFMVNQWLLRYLSPEVFGLSVQLEVYYITILFFARESLRIAIQRQTDTPNPCDSKILDDSIKAPVGYIDAVSASGRTQAVVNLSYITFILGIVSSICWTWAYLGSTATDSATNAIPYFRMSVKIYGSAALVELLSEPCFVVVQTKSRFQIRAASEGFATLVRCVSTCAFAFWATRTGRDFGVLPFALGQCAYAISLLTFYHWKVWRIASSGGFSLFLKPIHARDGNVYVFSYFSWPLISLGGSIYFQSVIKHFLTQGDTIIIAFLASKRAQGVYALANNYGGLIARLVLQPIEESSRNYFGKLLSSSDGASSKEAISSARKSLVGILRSYILLSVCILAIGPTVAPLLLKIVAGSQWTDSGAGQVLGTYCYYIPLLAVNGLTEAFISSVATKSELGKQSMWMIAFSVGFGSAAFMFLRVLQLGANGLVWANICNMLFRIIWSIDFMNKYLTRKSSHGIGADEVVPGPATIAICAVTNALLLRMQVTFTGGFMDIVKCGLLAAASMGLIGFVERRHIYEIYLNAISKTR